jgi:hypothetical protein
MADLLDSIREELRERLKDLRPLVSEFERLGEAERVLSSQGTDSGGGTSQSTRGARSRRVTIRPRERAANREKLLAAVRERPGVTKAELKAATGLSGAGVAQNLRSLLDRGQLREQSLPGGVTGYRLGKTRRSGGGRST